MAFNIILVVLLLTCQHICCVMAAECTTAILASVFGTIGALLVIAALVALVWYCCRRRDSTSFSSTSSADTASDREFSFGTKTKGGGIGLNGSGTPVTFSHHYSEKAPSAAYNTSGVVNPAFGVGREVLIDMPPGHKGEVKIDFDGDPSIKPPAHNGDVRIDMDGGSGIKTPSGAGEVKLDMDLDHRHDVDFPGGNSPELNLPDVDLSADRSSGRSLPGAEANVVIKGPSKPKFDEADPSLNLETVDAYLDRPGRGGFGLLIARDKTLPPPALFIREVTPGGIAAKTGLIDKGDKIIAINDTSIEGLPHDQAMALLRDDDKKILHLTLQKKALYKLKGRSYDPPGGSMEESCKIDMSPVLEAGVPSFDVEGMQGDAPDLGTMEISGRKPHVDMPEGKLNTKMSGPHGFSDVDLSGPSSGLDLPSTKKKRGNCFSCASSGDKDEPYIKGKANSGLDLDRPDMETSGKVAVRGSGPDVSVPSTNTRGRFSGPSVDGERFELDSNGADLDISAGPKAQLGTNATDIETPDATFSTGKLKGPRGKLDAPTTDLDLSSKKKKGGNCFSCAGGTDKDESYKKRKGDSDFDFDGPDGSMKMRTGSKFDISGSGPNIKGPDGGIKQKEFGLRASAPDVDLDVDKGRHMDISSPDITLPSSGAAAKVSGPSFDGDVDISEPNVNFKTRKPKVGVDANAPEINPPSGRPEIDVSSGKVKGPSVKVDSPSPDTNLPSSKKNRGNCLTCTGSGEKNEPYIKSRNNAGYDLDGPGADLDISTGRPKVGLSTDTPDVDVDAPEGRPSTDMSGPDVELSTGRMRGPKTQVDVPSGELDLPSGKKKGGSCFSCAGDGDKGEPYGARKGKAGLNMSGPEVDGSMEMKNVSRPSIDASVPDVDISTRRPKAGFSTDAPDIDAPEGGLSTEMSGPDVEFSTGRMPGSRAQVDAEVDLPSGKKKGGSCFSCAGDGDKGEPYGARKRDAGFDLSEPEVDGSMKVKKTGKLDISGSGPELKGRGKNKDLGFHATGPDLSGPNLHVRGPKGGLSGPDFDMSGPKGGLSGPDFDMSGPKGGLSGPDFDMNGPKGGLSGPDFDMSGPKGGLSGPDFDMSGPKGGMSGPDFNASGPKGGMSGPDFGASGPKGGLSGPDFDASGPKGGLSGPEFDVSGPKGGLSGPDFDMSGPKGGLSGPDFDMSGPKGGLSGPDFDMSGPKGGMSGPDFNASGPKGGMSGPDFGASGPKGGLSGPDFDASGPKGGLSGPEFDVSGPKGGLSGPDFHDVSGPSPSAELGLPARKKKGGNCLSCAGGADKDEPYRKTKGNAEFAFKGPEVDLEGPDADLEGLDERKLDTPNVGGDVDFSRPSASLDAGGRGPGLDIGTGKTSVGVDVNAPSLRKPKGKLQTEMSSPDVQVSTGDVRGPRANLHGPSADGSLPSRKKTRGNCLSCAGDADKDEPYGRTSGNAEFELERPDIDGSLEVKKAGKFDLRAPSTDIKDPDFKVNTPDIDLASDKPNIGFKSPELDITKAGGKGEIDIERPEFSHGKPKVSGPSFDVGGKNIGIKGPDLDIDTPQGHGVWGFSKPNVPVGPSADITGPDGKLDLDVNRPDLDISAPKSRFGGKGFDMDTPEPDIPAGDFQFGGSMPDGKLDLDVNRPDLDISAPKSRFGGKGFHMDTPEPDIPAGDFQFGGSMPDGKLDLDVNRPDLDISAPKSRFGRKGFDMDTPESDIPAGDFQFGGSMPDGKLDLDVNQPDLDISAPKSRFGGMGFHMDTLEPDIPAGDFQFGGSMPDGKLDLDVNRPHLDISAPKSRFGGKGFDMDTPEPDIPAGDFQFGGSMPDGKLDLDVNQRDLDISVPKSRFGGEGFDMDTPEQNGGWSLQPGGKDYDANFDWGVNTSTPNKEVTLLPHAELELESEPLERDISVANDYNFDLQSTPKTFPSVEYEEPRSLQRYDEIRPDMELRLLSPTQTDQSDPSFNFEIPHNSLSMEKNASEDRPSRMSLVKVEENVTICSASLEEDELPSPRKRTLTLDREIKQKIEVVFPGEEGSDTKQKSSTSSSSSSTSDADADKEKKSKRKKKSRLLKAFRKDSNSSASSKEDGTLSKAIIQERKRSTSSSSSSSSDESPSLFKKKNVPKRKGSKSSSSSDKEKRKGKTSAKEIPAPEVTTVHPIKVPEPDYSFKVVTPDSPLLPRKSLKPKKQESSTSSSSSDDEVSKKRSVKQKEPEQRKSSTSSTSSADKDDSKNTKLPKSSRDADAPVEYNVAYTTIPKQFLVSEETKEPEKPESSVSTVISHSVIPAGPELSYVLKKPDEKTDPKGRKGSTSSSSDEEKTEYKISPEDPKPSMLYHVEYFTNQQKYIIEPHDDIDKPEISIADVQEDASEVEFHAVETSDPKERKSSTSSSSSEESGRLSPKLDVTVHRYETVHHVLAPDYPSTDQLANVSTVEEHPLVVVSRSFKRQMPESEDQSETQYPSTSTEIQFSEPPMDVTYHLEYPYNIRTATEDSNLHVQEDGIVPVVKSISVEYEIPDLSIPAKKEDRSSPTWDIKTHTFETVYHVNIPEKPARDASSFEIEEQSPIVVSRSINRISPALTTGDDDLEEEVQLLTNEADVQFSEPSNDFQLEYPEGEFSITGEHHLPIADEQWIVTHSVEKDKPDITAALALLDRPDENAQLKSDSSQDTDDKVTSPREKSPRRDSERRNSNSRLWELMQGYLIERPVMDDDGTEPESEKTAEVKKEEDSKIESVKSEPKEERIVYTISHKPVQFEPVNVQVGEKEHTKEAIMQVPKVESIVPKVTPVAPVTFQVDVGDKKPVVKEHHAAWKKQASLPLDVDDNDDDPWMRHYSKGLHQRGQHQPSATKSPAKESSFAQSRSLSLSKVPHVKGVRTFSEQESERPRYSIESRTRTEQVPHQSSTDRSQTGTSRQNPTNRPSVSSLRSFWDK